MNQEQQWQAATDAATKQFAETHRLHVRRDECGDQIILGRRGHLWFDGETLCFMGLDRKPAKKSTWKTLGGELWLGDISPEKNGKRVQDVKIIGVTNTKAAIRMAGLFPKRELSPEHRAKLASSLAKARQSL